MMENRNMRVVHPGEIFREEIIKPKELTITQTAKLLGVTRTTVSNIVNERSNISPEMAIRIAKVFGGNARIWVNMQTKYDLQEAFNKTVDLNLKPFQDK